MASIDFDPTRPAVQQDPYPWFRRLRDESPVHYIESVDAWGLFRYADCKHTFLHPEDYSARDFITQAFGDLDPVPETRSLIAMDPPEHTPLRKLAATAFVPSVTRRMEPKIRQIINELLDGVESPTRSFDFVNDFAAYVPVSVTAELLGIDASQRENFKVWTADLLNAANRASLDAQEVARIRASVAELRAYLEQIIEERRQAPKDDFISNLVTAEVDNKALSTLETLSTTILTHFGGSETPSHLISSALIAMLEHGEVHEALRADRSLAGALVEETLRFWSPVNLVFQTATRDLTLYDQTIPKGAYVLSYIGSANRDERRFDHPDQFDLGRDPHGHLSFAHGPHYCPGASLGRTMCTIALETVLERMPQMQRASPTTDWLPSLWVRGAKTLPVIY